MYFAVANEIFITCIPKFTVAEKTIIDLSVGVYLRGLFLSRYSRISKFSASQRNGNRQIFLR